MKHDPDVSALPPARVRQLIRDGTFSGPTSGAAMGYVQANLAFVPSELADAFERMCAANPQPLPLIERLPAGRSVPQWSAAEADVATDTGKYSVFDGSGWSTSRRVSADLLSGATAFVIGCSFTAEEALAAAGVHLKQIGNGGGVPVYRTSTRLESAGGLEGHLVVSMRAVRKNHVDLATRITAEFPVAHGSPVRVGDGAAIGCRDGDDPDWGVPMSVEDDEVPVYWACGVTPQMVIEESGMPWAVTHSPGHMFITDIPVDLVRGLTAEQVRDRIRSPF